MVSCGDPEKAMLSEQQKKDSLNHTTQRLNLELRNYNELNDAPGFAGIYFVPEMLTLCVKDSASLNKMAERYAQAFTTLEAELQKLQLKSSGAPGAINYNNDPNNLVFECVYPIDVMPKKQPTKCQVVVLEESNMLVYNYYGTYEALYKGYDKIGQLMKENNLVQSGPMREFYITDPGKVSDSTKWLTRIMVPVFVPKAK